MKILWSSDHHLLHQTTPTYHILGNLSTFLIKDNDLSKVDLVVFGGDFLDRLVESPNPDMFKVSKWVKMFLERCKKANPKMTIIWLEGTSSHDWGQPKNFLNQVPDGLDVRYVDSVVIHTYPQYDDLTILHIPDNLGSLTPDEIWELALEELARNNLDKVDLIFFHGGFDFQLHPKARHKAHQLERWETIVVFGIFAGHIHIPTQVRKLFTSGSFDRTRHGEEHPKGGYSILLDKSKNLFEPTFYENKRALPYVTLKVDESIEPKELVNRVKKFIKSKDLVTKSQIRIMGGSAQVVNPIINMLSKEYPNFGFKAENETDQDANITDQVYDGSVYQGSTLTKDNITKSLLPEINEKIKLSELNKDFVLGVLEEFL